MKQSAFITLVEAGYHYIKLQIRALIRYGCTDFTKMKYLSSSNFTKNYLNLNIYKERWGTLETFNVVYYFLFVKLIFSSLEK